MSVDYVESATATFRRLYAMIAKDSDDQSMCMAATKRDERLKGESFVFLVPYLDEEYYTQLICGTISPQQPH